MAIGSAPLAEDRSDIGRSVNGPRFRTPFGLLAAFRANPLAFLEQCTRQYGDRVEIRFGPWRTYLFTRPEDVQHILQENHRNYWKGFLVQKLKRVAGEGLVFSDGDLWRRQRQLIQPAFHRERVDALADMMVRGTAALVDRWQVHARSGHPLDVAEEMSRLTLEIVTQALFSADLGTDTDELIAAVTAGMRYANHLMNHFWTPPLWVPTRVNRDGRRALASLDRIVNRVIADRRRDPQPRADLLDMLLTARDAETDVTMDDKQLRDEIVTFLVAGHETTAVALSWTWYLLAQHEAVESRLHAELARGTERSPRDLASREYVRMTIEESMRLYPPVWGMARDSYGEDRIGGIRIRPRSTVSVSPYLTHRHPDFWNDPERFDPERFTLDRRAARPAYAYFPFGGGPRGCIGKQFAMLEARIVVAMVAQQFRLRLVPGQRIEPHPIFTLRPRDGIRMTIHPR